MNNKSLWEVGEVVEEKTEEKPVMFKTCPFKSGEHREVMCHGAKCGLWSDVGRACSFVVIANDIYGGE